MVEFNHLLCTGLFHNSVLQFAQVNPVLTAERITNIPERDGWIQSQLITAISKYVLQLSGISYAG